MPAFHALLFLSYKGKKRVGGKTRLGLKQHYTGFFLCNVVWSLSGNTEFDVFLCFIVWSLKGNTAQGFYLCNIVPIVSSPGTTLHRKKYYAMLPLRVQAILHKKNSCSMLS